MSETMRRQEVEKSVRDAPLLWVPAPNHKPAQILPGPNVRWSTGRSFGLFTTGG